MFEGEIIEDYDPDELYKQWKELEKAKRNKFNFFGSEKKLESHLKKHLSEYLGYTSRDYVARANKLLNSSENSGILSFNTKDGKTLKYDII